MKDWTLVNEFGDRIERIPQRILVNATNGVRTEFSYWTVIDGKRKCGHINKIKKLINDKRKITTTWKEVWE